MASDRSASNDYVPCATLNGRGTHAATAEVIAIIYNFLPSLPLALPSAATRRNHKAVYDHSCSQSVGPPERGTGACVSACADRNREAASSAAAVPILPRRRGETATTMRHCIVAKTYEARNKIYAVVFLNAREGAFVPRWQCDCVREADGYELPKYLSASERVTPLHPSAQR